MQHKHNKMVIMRGKKPLTPIASTRRGNNHCRQVCECYWNKRSTINYGPKKKKTEWVFTDEALVGLIWACIQAFGCRLICWLNGLSFCSL